MKALLFVGYQFSCFSGLQQTTKFCAQRKVNFPMSCKAKTGKTRNQESTNINNFFKSSKIGTHENKYFHSNSSTDSKSIENDNPELNVLTIYR